jgi:hypothetical protein
LVSISTTPSVLNDSAGGGHLDGTLTRVRCIRQRVIGPCIAGGRLTGHQSCTASGHRAVQRGREGHRRPGPAMRARRLADRAVSHGGFVRCSPPGYGKTAQSRRANRGAAAPALRRQRQSRQGRGAGGAGFDSIVAVRAQPPAPGGRRCAHAPTAPRPPICATPPPVRIIRIGQLR